MAVSDEEYAAATRGGEEQREAGYADGYDRKLTSFLCASTLARMRSLRCRRQKIAVESLRKLLQN